MYEKNQNDRTNIEVHFSWKNTMKLSLSFQEDSSETENFSLESQSSIKQNEKRRMK